MKVKLLKITIALSVIYLTKQLSALDQWTEVKVINCHDGDTCHVEVSGALTFKVRLAGIDCPELGNKRNKNQSLAPEARDFLNSKVKGKKVFLRQIDLDHYNRPIVEMKIKEKIVNLQLLEKGLAEVYRKSGPKLEKSIYYKAESTAKKSKLGIWGLAHYQTPHQYRKSKNKKR